MIGKANLFSESMTLDGGVIKKALVTPCGRYRYTLTRHWAQPPTDKPAVGWIMLNPSTADADVDDPTIRRCMGFARAWGYGGIEVCNLFALRATDPRVLCKAADPIGLENDRHLLTLADACPLIVCAWGVHGRHRNRGKDVMRLLGDLCLKPLHCLGVTKEGHPKHPLYLPADAELVPFGRV